MLCKALSDIVDLVVNDLARVVVFPLTYKLALQWLLASRHI